VPIGESYLLTVLEELTENAFKFSASGTPVVVTSRREGDDLLITVTDHGRGMTPEQIEAFGAREADLYQQRGQGIGLGLALVRRIAGLYGGDLRITSTPGVGTTVTVRLPLS
jgi:signal transduction histidine kinase